MSVTSLVTIIIGAQWGDEGKGKITDYFAGQNDYVVRYHGGNNAGHTLVVNGTTYKLHLIPSGVLYSHVTSVIGNGVLVDPGVLLQEIRGLQDTSITPRLKISQRAHVIMPYHIAMDEGLSGHQGALAAGSTKRGIAPVAADKAYRHGIRVGDLLEPDILKEKLHKAYHFNTQILEKVFQIPFDRTLESIYDEYVEYGKQLAHNITDTELELYHAIKQGKKILFEGAQGMSLDPDHGMYPYTTSTNNIAGYAAVGCGVTLNTPCRIIGVVKAYLSRVGESPVPTELTNDTGDKIREDGHEYGTTTNRPRRIGWLDLVQVRQSVRTSGLTEIALTKIDVLGGLSDIQVCVAYDIDGERVLEMPASLEKIRKAQPIYETLPGWEKIDEQYIKEHGYNGFPAQVKQYIAFIEKESGCRISIVSYGPDRTQTVVR